FYSLVCPWISIFSSILNSNSKAREELLMKKNIARITSKALTSSARLFSAVLKPWAHSPEAPKELRK
ncbi:hypothetical protein, partial [Paenibacillus riograndensis]|uniref:hypothetical protein n=1 Tax=Paenibacillus riograndensis TaxID=483937 RepID=UPI001B7FACBC